MKRFPFQCVASGKRGGATLGMAGCHAARTGRAGVALPATRSVEAMLPRTGKCCAARNGRYYIARNEKCYAAGSGAPVGNIPESNSAIAIARLLYCQISRIARTAAC